MTSAASVERQGTAGFCPYVGSRRERALIANPKANISASSNDPSSDPLATFRTVTRTLDVMGGSPCASCVQLMV